MADLETEGRRIARARRRLAYLLDVDIKPADLARLVGVEASTVESWEDDAKRPKEESRLRLARVLGVRPAYLHYGEMPIEMEDWAPPDISALRSAPVATSATELLQQLGVEPRRQVALTREQVQERVDRSREEEAEPARKTAGKKRRR